MHLLIFGPPGAGKGTQAEIIAKKHNLLHISSGELLRKAINSKKLGTEIKKLLDSGRLAPNKIINPIMEKIILDFKPSKKVKGIIIDGYPRNLVQARFLDKLLNKKGEEIAALINLKLNYVDAISRILVRAKSSGRSDDNLSTINQRLKVYKKETKPILDYYKKQKKLINLNGALSIKEVSQEISQTIKKL